MTVEELIKEKGADIRKIAAQHGARNIRIFGSVARVIQGRKAILTF